MTVAAFALSASRLNQDRLFSASAGLTPFLEKKWVDGPGAACPQAAVRAAWSHDGGQLADYAGDTDDIHGAREAAGAIVTSDTLFRMHQARTGGLQVREDGGPARQEPLRHLP
jgi:hypothetical protein